MDAIEQVAVAKIEDGGDNVRDSLGELTDLAASIKAQGVLEPLVVDAGGRLVFGHRRLAAAKKAGLKEVPVVRREFTEEGRLEAMLVENLQREGLTPLEEATGFKRLADLGRTQRDIAKAVGLSQTHVAKRIALLDLPEKVQQLADSGSISLSDAHELAKVKDDPKLVEKIATGNVGGYGRSISSAVQEEQSRRKKEKEVAAIVRKLKKDGETVVDVSTDQYGYSVTLPNGHARVRAETWAPGEVPMQPSKHKKLKCHAVGVNPRTLDVFEVCTDPKKHPTQADRQKEIRAKREAQIRKEEEEWQALQQRRRQFLREEIAARVNKDTLLELCLISLRHDDGYWGNGGGEEEEIACLLLAVNADEAEGLLDDVPLDDAGEVFYELLEQEIAKGGAYRQRATFAIAAARIEASLSRHGRWNRAYFDWLKARGYEASAEELEHLEPEADIPPEFTAPTSSGGEQEEEVSEETEAPEGADEAA